MEGLFIPQASFLGNWRAICLQWIAEIVRFSEIMSYEDAIHEQLERANSGTLGIAAAKCGYGVLFEPNVNRSGKGGYLDICLFDSVRDTSIFVECKWINPDNRSSIGYFKSKLDEASNQLSGISASPILTASRYKKVERAAIVFVCPTFDANSGWDNIKSGLLDTIKTCEEAPFYDVMAWCFSEQLSSTVRRYQKIHPGIIMYCKAVNQIET
jgi:hypothetical protein